MAAFVAAAFDELLGMTQSHQWPAGHDPQLHRLPYRRPTPLHRELRFVGTLDRVDGRKDLDLRPLLRRRPDLTAEATGLFIHVDFQRLAAMLTTRDHPAD